MFQRPKVYVGVKKALQDGLPCDLEKTGKGHHPLAIFGLCKVTKGSSYPLSLLGHSWRCLARRTPGKCQTNLENLYSIVLFSCLFLQDWLSTYYTKQLFCEIISCGVYDCVYIYIYK